MAPLRVQAAARRHEAVLAYDRMRGRSRRPVSRDLPELDSRTRQLARGLMYGMPLGIALWLLLALLIWRIV